MPNISTFKSPGEMTHHNTKIQTWARLGKLKIYPILKNKEMKRAFFLREFTRNETKEGVERCWDTGMRRLTTRIRSEKCVVRRFRRCANVIQCTYTNLDSTDMRRLTTGIRS